VPLVGSLKDDQSVPEFDSERRHGNVEFDAKYKELDLGLVDGTVAALSERRKVYRVLTTDRRDFATIRVGQRFLRPLEVLP
jgi:predicted nucleic acid-binding protein